MAVTYPIHVPPPPLPVRRIIPSRKIWENLFIKNDKEVHQGPSILEVEIYSMIALRIFVLVCASTGELLPNKSILNKKISL